MMMSSLTAPPMIRIPNSLARNGWRQWHIVAATFMVLAGIFVTREAWADIFRIAYRSEESSHIFLVPIVFAWLVWVRRGRMRQCRPIGQWVGPLVIALGWFASSFGYNSDMQSVWHAGALLTVIGCLITVTGVQLIWKLMPAFVVLGFLIPVPGAIRQQIAQPLQEYTAIITHTIFQLFGVESARSGNLLQINGVDVGIAEACNGLRMVFALTLVSYAFAFGTPLRPYARVLILAGSPVSAIACNVIRLLPTVWLYGHVDMNIADKFHDISGWVMLFVAFMILMGIIRLLQWALVPVTRFTLAYD
jgi:exosortase